MWFRASINLAIFFSLEIMLTVRYRLLITFTLNIVFKLEEKPKKQQQQQNNETKI